jgi:hypothetical protein
MFSQRIKLSATLFQNLFLFGRSLGKVGLCHQSSVIY